MAFSIQGGSVRKSTTTRDVNKSGGRFVLAGRLVMKPGQQLEKCLPLVERVLIRHFLSEGHDLVNIQGTHLSRHEVVSRNRPLRFAPSPMYLDK